MACAEHLIIIPHCSGADLATLSYTSFRLQSVQNAKHTYQVVKTRCILSYSLSKTYLQLMGIGLVL